MKPVSGANAPDSSSSRSASCRSPRVHDGHPATSAAASACAPAVTSSSVRHGASSLALAPWRPLHRACSIALAPRRPAGGVSPPPRPRRSGRGRKKRSKPPGTRGYTEGEARAGQASRRVLRWADLPQLIAAGLIGLTVQATPVSRSARRLKASRVPASDGPEGPLGARSQPDTGTSCCLCRDAMSLSGLLRVIADDPQLRRALELADGETSHPALAATGGADLVGPPALRPILAAALTGQGITSQADAGQGDAGQGITSQADAGQGDAGQGDAGQGDAGPGDAGQGAAGPGAAGQPPAAPRAGAGQPPAAARFVLAVTATAREAEDLTAALNSLLPAATAAYFPPWETLPHERLSPRSDTSGQRIAVLRRLARPDTTGDPRSGPLTIVATPVRGLLQPIVGWLGGLAAVRLRAGQDADLDDVLVRLVEIGYARTELVGNRGELAVRGGILDVFPPTEEHPVRIEFWGDTVEDIRYFKVADQRSLQTAADGLWAPPCRELLLTPAVRERAKELAAAHPGLADVLGKLADGITVEGMEAFAPVLAGRMDLLLDYIPRGGCVLACDPERIRARAADLVRTSQEFLEASWVSAAAGAQMPIDLGAAVFQPITRVRAAAAALGLPWWTIAPFQSENTAITQSSDGSGHGPDAADAGDETSRPSFSMEASPAEAYRGDTARVLADVGQWLTRGWRVVLVTEGHGPAQRLAELLRGEGLGA